MSKHYIPEGFYTLKSLPKGELFKRKMTSRKVYVKGDYDRGSKTYSVYDYENINSEMFAKGSLKVYAGFTY
jgi:hypothetical protein